MIGGALLNAAAFTVGNYLAKYLAGDNGQAALDKKTRHEKTLEAYQAAMAKCTREGTQIFDWIETIRTSSKLKCFFPNFAIWSKIPQN